LYVAEFILLFELASLSSCNLSQLLEDVHLLHNQNFTYCDISMRMEKIALEADIYIFLNLVHQIENNLNYNSLSEILYDC